MVVIAVSEFYVFSSNNHLDFIWLIIENIYGLNVEKNKLEECKILKDFMYNYPSGEKE